MKSRLVAAALAASALAAPAAAHGATLSAPGTKPCYGTADAVPLVGAGYIPGSPTRLARDGVGFPRPIPPDATGGFAIIARLSTIPRGKTRTVFSASDIANPALTASTPPIRVSATTIRLRPANAAPTFPRRIRANGFTVGKTLFMHVVRGGRSRNVRVGRLKGACRAVQSKRRFFRRNPATGQYRLQFDTFRRYKRSRVQKVVFPLNVVRRFRRSSVSSSLAGSGSAVVGGSGLGTAR